MTDLHTESLASIRDLISSGSISAAEVTETLLSRIRDLNPVYQAYTNVLEVEALEAARAADAALASGQLLGPLHGVPVAIKDLLDMEGQRTGCASLVRKHTVARQDATVVQRLKAAGAVILGKLNMTEFALSGYHPDLPVPVNPWGAGRWSGVSSSGSAVATATGLAFGTLGSDTGGSIRFPAAVNGVVGIKPTFGAVSKHGAFPLSYTLDHIGPITRSVEDAAILLNVIQGYDADDPFSRRVGNRDLTTGLNDGVKGLRIGIDDRYNATDADPQVTAAVQEASRLLEELGAELVAVGIMDTLAVAPYWGPVVAAEAAVAHAGTYPLKAQEYGPVFGGLLASAGEVSGALITEARLATARAAQAYETAFRSVDVILCPGAPLPAMPLEEFPPTAVLPPDAVASFVGFTAPMNFTGLPTVSAPCGFSKDHLPLGMQFVGPKDSEGTLIRTAYSYEQATEWAHLWPPITLETNDEEHT